MRAIRVFLCRLGGLFDNRRKDRELAEEIESHLGMVIEDNIRSGMTPKQARRNAFIKSGGLELAKEAYRDRRSLPVLETVMRDLRHALRLLRRSPAFTVVTVLLLALGIGANTAIFTLLDQLMLRLLPVKDPEQLVMIWTTGPSLGGNQGSRASSYPLYQDFQARAQAFSYVFCRYYTPLSVSMGNETERVTGELVSGNYFQALGVRPAAGRVFSPEEDDRVYKGHPAVVLSYRYWVTRFGADPGVVGEKILVNSYPMIIVGVSAAGFSGIDPARSPQIRIPIQMKTLEDQLDETLGTERLTAMLSAAFGALATILVAVGLYGVMALVVVRRTREIGLRMALGAPQGAILCMVMREALGLLGIGLAVGIPCAYWLSRYVSSQLFGVAPTDIRTAVVASAILVVVTAGAGLLPARRASLIDPIRALKHE